VVAAQPRNRKEFRIGKKELVDIELSVGNNLQIVHRKSFLMGNLDDLLSAKLAQRKEQGTFRSLRTVSGLADFTSNDYLGFSRSVALKKRISENENAYSASARLLNTAKEMFDTILRIV